jgi:hypothetical protein
MENLMSLLLEKLGAPALRSILRTKLPSLGLAEESHLWSAVFREMLLHDFAALSQACRAMQESYPRLVADCLRSAHLQATSESVRERIRELAAELGQADIFESQEGQASPFLTSSQAAALDRLDAMARLFFRGRSNSSPVSLRLNPLILGPSGMGKSHLVATLASRLRLPLLRLCVGDWIVSGARQDPCTMQVVQAAIDQHRSGFVLHIDELDKATSDEQWTQVARQEIFALLDRRVGYTGTNRQPWLETHDAKLRTKVFIVGSGAWHEIWESQASRRRLGFQRSAEAAEEMQEIEAAIRRSKVIPAELTNRFSPWVPLRPLESADFVEIAQQLGLPADFDAQAAAQSRLNFRYLEAALTEAAIKQELARAAVGGSTTIQHS